MSDPGRGAQHRVVIVGAGFAGTWIHARAYREAGIPVAAICDLDDARRQQAQAEYEIPRGYADWRQMYEREEPDVVSVALPNMFHEEPVVAALNRGAHVLCEKPIATSVAAAERMFAAAHRSGRILMAAQMYRFFAGTRVIKAAVDRGDLGAVYYAEATAMRRLGIPGGVFHRSAFSGGGPLLDIGVHMLDQALWLMGNPRALRVSAATARHFGDRAGLKTTHYDPHEFDVEDFATAYIRLEGGATLLLRASWVAHLKDWEVMDTRLVGTEGGAATAPPVIHRTRDGVASDETFVNVAPGDAWIEEIRHFLAVVDGEVAPLIQEVETMNVQRILDAAYESAARGEEVAIAATTAPLAAAGGPPR